MNNYIKTISFCFKNNKLLFLITVITSVVGFTGIFAFAKLVEESINVVLNNSSDFNVLYMYSIYVIISFVIGLISTLCILKLNYKVKEKVKNDILKQISNLEYEYLEDFTWSNKIQKAIVANESFKRSISHFINITKAIILFVIYIIAIKDLGNEYIIICIMLLLLVVLITFKTNKSFNKSFETLEIDEKKDNYIFSLLNDKRSNAEIKINKLYNELETRWEDNYSKKEKKYRVININGIKTSTILNVFYICFSTYVLYNIILLIQNDIHDISMFSAVFIILSNIYYTIDNLGFEFRDFVKINNYTKEYFNIMKIKNNDKEIKTKDIKSVKFEKLSYIYPNTKNVVLKDISIEFKTNNLYLIVGINGSGKTTLVNNILGLLKPTKGKLFINDKEERIDSIKDNSYAVFQDYIDYQLTLRENITLYYKGEYSDKSLYKILDEVGLKGLSLDVNIGDLVESGINLSKGQRQKVAIARMILNSDKDIIVLDEPTSYLDPISELEIFRVIKKYSKDKIILLVSHRLGFSKDCDNIVYLKDGNLDKIMKHDELMEFDNEYKLLYETQKDLYIKDKKNT